MRLINRDLELNERYTVKTEMRNGRQLTEDFLINHVMGKVAYLLPYGSQKHPFFKEMFRIIGCDTTDQWWSYGGEEYRGDLPTRIRKYFYLKGLRIPNEEYNVITREIADSSIMRINEMQIEVTDIIDWQPGEFWEETSSCWWDDYYSTGKTAIMWEMKHDRAFAIKIFDKYGDPMGRCFALRVPNKNDVILFNIYVRARLAGHLDFLNLFSEFLGVQYLTSELNVSGNAYFYVNGAPTGYVFSENLSDIQGEYNFAFHNYVRPYDPVIERYRLPDKVDHEACDVCHRHVYQGLLRYFLPQKQNMCSNCQQKDIKVLNTYGEWKNGRRVYYDSNYYMNSKKTPGKIVRKKGKVWLAE